MWNRLQALLTLLPLSVVTALSPTVVDVGYSPICTSSLNDWVFDAPRPGGPSPDSARPEYARAKPGGRCYAEGLYKAPFGAADLGEFEAIWANRWAWDALDFYAVSDTWLRGDVSANPTHGGDLRKALGAIEATVHLMPGSTDQYFIAEEIADEAAMIPGCVFAPLVSPMGHVAESAADMQPQINGAIAACLAKSASNL